MQILTKFLFLQSNTGKCCIGLLKYILVQRVLFEKKFKNILEYMLPISGSELFFKIMQLRWWLNGNRFHKVLRELKKHWIWTTFWRSSTKILTKNSSLDLQTPPGVILLLMESKSVKKWVKSVEESWKSVLTRNPF